ncbi:MAG TPA: sigma-54-dependent Fis family transcriptional regulator [Verrucomicrobia bacterium]|nr:sigma-54-dependent Fis family transcriptional regulator [Verrucomicrobiota bacterium]HCG19833.1 sigma-54-dependent Fis family transcriptional regulator [Verrucomicrobiota bacterium]
MSEKVPSEIAVLQEITTAVVRERNVRKLFDQVLDILERDMGMIRGTIALLEGDELRIESSSRALNAEERSLGRYRVGEGITGLVAKTGKPEVVPDVRKDSRFLNRTKVREADEAVSFICVPLIHLGQVVGTLSVDRKIRAEEGALARDVTLLGIIANITAEAASVFREECAEHDALIEENRKLRGMISNGNPGRLIGDCREMRVVYEQIRQVAPSEATVLIRGASGTGKELVARAIQSLSLRKDKPFVVLNCAALPEALVESELFGHEKGAFTDARERRIGRAEAANGGTLFLDEIGDLSIPVQVKLLRFLQERTFSRVGSNEELRSDVRFIAATSRNLEELMAQKLFREDLYYRLSVFPISMPDLASRTGDVILLAQHFLSKMNVKYGKHVTHISSPAINMLQAYAWPGNVRELENCMERAVLTAKDDCIHSYNLPPALQTPEFAEDPFRPDVSLTLDEQLAIVEKRILESALKRHDGNRSAAGRELGVSPRMMTYRLARAGIH